MNIAYITNAPKESGVGSRAYHIRRTLQSFPDIMCTDVAFNQDKLPFRPWPGVLGSKSINWIRWGHRIPTDRGGAAGLYDITNQTLSFLARRLSPSVVTVHDLIEALEPQDKKASFINTYLYSGITRATHVIAVSQYTKKTLVKHYGMLGKDITVIPNGVGHEFYPIDNFSNSIGYQQLRQEMGLSDAHPLILYVGSDHPRKNIPTALTAFARLKKKRPDAVFIKVGEAGILAGRAETLAAIDHLGIKESVKFIGNVSDEKLNLLYNLADALVFPSRFEGFGLPPLQAMAAGLPVVCSNSTSLPEVVGDAALLHKPDDVDSLHHLLEKITEDTAAAAEHRRRGLARAKKFSWDTSAKQVHEIYKKVFQLSH